MHNKNNSESVKSPMISAPGNLRTVRRLSDKNQRWPVHEEKLVMPTMPKQPGGVEGSSSTHGGR